MVEGNFVRHAVPNQGRRPEKGEMDWVTPITQQRDHTLSPLPQFQLTVKLAVAKGDRGQVRTAKVAVTSQPVEDPECSTPQRMRGLLGGLFGKYKRLSFRDTKREGGEGGGMATDSGPPGILPQTVDEPTIEQRPLETRPQKRFYILATIALVAIILMGYAESTTYSLRRWEVWQVTAETRLAYATTQTPKEHRPAHKL
ncbi:hypothetical protein EYF80_064021 [Liparis tanakae]|uniref:Uncharacterized protein n=1 Tax=Liparis tanakae TaxID=230148 RepID=A0A4Z2EAE6_9TELE|nr:hypothetical protein EYF80_064021 [Liparis tanakae]